METSCREHPGKPLEFYCRECDAPTCATCCVLGIHRLHTCVSIADSADRMHEILFQWVARADAEEKALATAAVSAKAAMEVVATAGQRMTRELATHVEDVVELIRRRAAEVHNEILSDVRMKCVAVGIFADDVAQAQSHMRRVKAAMSHWKTHNMPELYLNVKAVSSFATNLDKRWDAVRKDTGAFDVSLELPGMHTMHDWLSMLKLREEVLHTPSNETVSLPHYTQLPEIHWDPEWKHSDVVIADANGLLVRGRTSQCGRGHHVRSRDPLPGPRAYWEVRCKGLGNGMDHVGIVNSSFSILEPTQSSAAFVLTVPPCADKAVVIGMLLDVSRRTLVFLQGGVILRVVEVSSYGPFFAYAAVCCEDSSVALLMDAMLPRDLE